jgi:hypothetical protein
MRLAEIAEGNGVLDIKDLEACEAPPLGRQVKSLQGEHLQTHRVARRVDVLTGTQAIELDWLKGNKFHEGIGQALHYGDVTGQQPVLALISAYYNIFGAE